MKKYIYVFSFILLVFLAKTFGQNIFYYSSLGDKISLIVDSTIQYVKVLDGIDSSSFLHELENVAEITYLSDQICCRINNHNISAFNNICSNNSNAITHKSAQLMLPKDSSIVWATDVVVTGVKPGLDIAEILSSNRINYVNISPVSASSNEFFVKLSPDSNAIDIANKLFQTGSFIYAQPTFVRQNALQNALFSYQWSLLNTGQYCDTSGFDIRVTDAWNLTQGDSAIIVAVIDEGCDLYHEDLQTNLLEGKNMVYTSENGMEVSPNYHGTPCAGIIAAEDNEIGVVGVAPKCKILPLINADNIGRTVDTASIRAFTYLLDSTNVSVVSCSWMINPEIEGLANAIKRFITNGRNGKGGVVLFAAGNYDEDDISYLGDYLPDCIFVGAICPDGTRKVQTSCDGNSLWGSNYGEGLCVMAPGVNIATTMTHGKHSQFYYIDDKYVTNFWGTSAATPHVAGVAALVLSANPNLSGKKVKEIIERTCTKVRQNDPYSYDSIAPHGTWDYQMGYGLVNAYQAVLMAQGCKDYPYCTIDTIRGNVTWNAPITVGEDLVIDSLATLTVTDTVAFYSESRIIVRPGGKLIVNGGTLTSACDGEMWEGIVVEGNATLRQLAGRQGSVILNNATVENARTAISTHKANDSIWVGGGGIVQATNTLFRNNSLSAELTPYENHKTTGAVTDNVSHFTRCTFTVDNGNLFASNDDAFTEHALLWQVRGVKFNGCDFRNETTGTSGTARGHAIRTMEAGFKAKRVCPQLSNTDPCVCLPHGSDTVTRCSFSGFHSAISAANAGGDHDITVDNCDFFQNGWGVDMAAVDNAQVSFCDFDLQSSASACYGINLSNCTGYTIEDNSFHRPSHSGTYYAYGVRVNNSGTAENNIRRNGFLNMNYGCYTQNTNALTGMKTRGLQFSCNDFDHCKMGIYASSGSKIRGTQGSTASGADNTFSQPVVGGKSLVIPSDHDTVTYCYSIGNDHMPYGSSRYRLLTATANTCLSTLCDGLIPMEPRGETALAQYRAMEEELADLTAEFEGRSEGGNDEAEGLLSQISELSAAMGDLSRAAIRGILSDTVVDMLLLKEWYRTIHTQVAKYQMSELYSGEGDWAAARGVLADIPVLFAMDSADADEYLNYLALQRLRENVGGNWYRQTQTEIEELQGVAEHNDGRAARMAKEILCFFHHICHEDELPFELDGIGERRLGGDAMDSVAATSGTLTLHPNPAHSTLTVESDSPVREITVYDQTGRTVAVETRCTTSLRQDINTSSLHAGIYILKVVTDNGTETAKFVKK